MNVLKRWVIRQLSQRAKPYLQSYGFLRTVGHHPAVVWKPRGGRVLVLAPHMDDEVIGCGGTLYKHIRNGAEVTVVYMTDGRNGSSTIKYLSGEEKRRRERELVETRKWEAQMAMRTLGIKQGIFLDAEDWNLSSTPEIQSRLREILYSIEPDVVYLPFFLEEHPDHRMTSRILIDATEGTSFQFECCGYEVWTALFPNYLVDISDAVEVKKQALEHYQSQLIGNNYVHASIGLNAYRSILLCGNNSGFVEAFFLTSLQEYRELYKSYGGMDAKNNGTPQADKLKGGRITEEAKGIPFIETDSWRESSP